jgi:hypothetical protein
MATHWSGSSRPADRISSSSLCHCQNKNTNYAKYLIAPQYLVMCLRPVVLCWNFNGNIFQVTLNKIQRIHHWKPLFHPDYQSHPKSNVNEWKVLIHCHPKSKYVNTIKLSWP